MTLLLPSGRLAGVRSSYVKCFDKNLGVAEAGEAAVRRPAPQASSRELEAVSTAKTAKGPVVALSPARRPATGLGSPDKSTRSARPWAGTASRRWFGVGVTVVQVKLETRA